MRIELYGLAFDTPGASAFLWSPWRASQLEHKLFEAIRQLGLELDQQPEEWRLDIPDARTWRNTLGTVERVLKGWQEEASDSAQERRVWRWLLEADVDTSGYDHTGVPAALWVFLRLGIDRNRPGELEKAEDIDLEGFGLSIWPQMGRP